MNQEESIQISSRIGLYIANEAPAVSYTPQILQAARMAYTPLVLESLEIQGVPAHRLMREDFALLYGMTAFCWQVGLLQPLSAAGKRTDTQYTPYLRELFRKARRLSAEEFAQNPYQRIIRVPEVREEDYLLTNAAYEPGELLQYDMPDLTADLVVPSLGFFPARVTFPSLYEGIYPWMSVCPSEIHSMQPGIDQAHGHVLVLGLGLGYYPFMISRKKSVHSITIVELEPIVIHLFTQHILPQFPPAQREKVHIVHAEAISFMSRVQKGDYDYCYADIWENQIDGAAMYEKLQPHIRRLGGPGGMTTRCWIEEAIRAQLGLTKHDGSTDQRTNG